MQLSAPNKTVKFSDKDHHPLFNKTSFQLLKCPINRKPKQPIQLFGFKYSNSLSQNKSKKAKFLIF